MSGYLVVVFVGLALIILVGIWLAKKMVRVALLALFLGVVAAAIYWFSREDLPTTLDLTEYVSTQITSSLANLF